MLVCPKCLKNFDDGVKICRDCGGILDQVETTQNDEYSEIITAQEYPLQPTSQESPIDFQRDQEESYAQSFHVGPWDCPKCKESMESNFDICWNCGAARHQSDQSAAPGLGR